MITQTKRNASGPVLWSVQIQIQILINELFYKSFTPPSGPPNAIADAVIKIYNGIQLRATSHIYHSNKECNMSFTYFKTK